MNNDRSIIKSLSAGDESAYEYLYATHYKALCVFANQYVGDYFTAETIVGDVIFHLWQNREALVIIQSLRNYLLKAVKNRCLNYLEELRRQEKLTSHITEVWERKQQNFEIQAEYPLSGLLERELDLKIEKTLAALPKLTRQIFELSRHSNLKYHEIAEKMGVSVDVVKYHIKSALSQLRTELKDYLPTIIIFFSLFR